MTVYDNGDGTYYVSIVAKQAKPYVVAKGDKCYLINFQSLRQNTAMLAGKKRRLYVVAKLFAKIGEKERLKRRPILAA